MVESGEYKDVHCYSCLAHTLNLLVKDVTSIRGNETTVASVTYVLNKFRNTQLLSSRLRLQGAPLPGYCFESRGLQATPNPIRDTLGEYLGLTQVLQLLVESPGTGGIS